MTEQTTKNMTEQERINRALKKIEELDPSQVEWKDASHLRAIAQAVDGVRIAEYELRLTVETARKVHGESWSTIAMFLGVSRQAARERWAKKVDG